jgi:hypothetical protein
MPDRGPARHIHKRNYSPAARIPLAPGYQHRPDSTSQTRASAS